jgi:aminopeptidase N
VLFLWAGASAVYAGGDLPEYLRPSHYRLHFVPDADLAGFSGEGEASFSATREFSSILLQADALELREAVLQPGDVPLTVTMRPAETQVELKLPAARPAGDYRLALRWRGVFSEQARGWYRLRYNTTAGERVMLGSQQEPTYARRVFPAWDEPGFRAKFSISAEMPTGWRAVSNGEVERVTPLANGRSKVVFATTPPMPTYLTALFMGEFEAIESMRGDTRLRLITTAGKSASGQYAQAETARLLDDYERYFGVPYGLPKLDQLAVPGGFGGGMENWGAIAYNERGLLYAPGRDSPDKQMRIFNLVAHEVGHQWFGNHVTVAWWDDLWLKEAFATWLAADVGTRLHPEWQTWLRQIDWLEEARQRDALPGSTPIRRPVRHRDEIWAAYDGLTYAKGAAVLRMLETWLGAERFRAGLHDYMVSHAHGNAVTDDLWRALPKAGGAETMAIALDWIDQPGLPVVSASQRCVDGETRLSLRQQRFLSVAADAKSARWRIPMILSRGDERRQVLFADETNESRWPGCKGWINVNGGGIGYYRVRYDDAAWRAMLRNWNALSNEERMSVAVDSFALLGTEHGDWRRYRQLASKLAADREPLILSRLVSQFEAIDAALPASRREAWARQAVPVLRKLLARVGSQPVDKEAAATAELRNALIHALSSLNDDKTVVWARRQFLAESQPSRHASPLDPRLADAVVGVMGRHGDAAERAAVWRLLKNGQSQDELRRGMNICNHRDPEVARDVLAASLDGRVPPYLAGRVVRCVAHEHPALTWRFLTESWDKLSAIAGEFALEPMFEASASNLTGDAGIAAARGWAPHLGVRAKAAGDSAEDAIRRRAALAGAARF